MTEFANPPPLRVMLVDDHPVVRVGYRRLLELEADFRVVGDHGDVDGALEAILHSTTGLPHVVIADLILPRRNGLDLIRELKSRAPQIRVLVISMLDNASIVSEALHLGAAGFVTKGSRPEELVSGLRRVMTQLSPVLSDDLAARHVLRLEGNEVPLSLKEIEVLRLLASGDSSHAIAAALQLSPKTVSNYQTMLKHKLGAASVIELMRHARGRGYVA